MRDYDYFGNGKRDLGKIASGFGIFESCGTRDLQSITNVIRDRNEEKSGSGIFIETAIVVIDVIDRHFSTPPAICNLVGILSGSG